MSTPSRRSFVRTAAAAAAALPFAKPFFVRAADKADARKLVTGRDAHQYEVLDNWAKLPEGYQFGNTHGVAQSADGRIFVHHAGGQPDSLAVFDPDGKFIKSWGAPWRAGAHGLQLRTEPAGEFLYLATTGQKRVVKTDLDGNVLFDFGYPKEAKNAAGDLCYQERVNKGDKTGKLQPADARYSPTNIAFHPTDGSFYVADGYGSSYVHRYDAKGQYLSTFGGKGADDGQLNCPHGIWCDTRDPASPVLVVADRTNERIAVFSLDGKFVKNYKPDNAAYRHPCHFDQRGQYLVCPGLQGVVNILDQDNNVYAALGDNPEKAQRAKNNWPKDKLIPGVFIAPHGAIFTSTGDIIVGEWLPYGRVTKLRHLA